MIISFFPGQSSFLEKEIARSDFTRSLDLQLFTIRTESDTTPYVHLLSSPLILYFIFFVYQEFKNSKIVIITNYVQFVWN